MILRLSACSFATALTAQMKFGLSKVQNQMSRKSDEEMERTHILLFKRDVERIKAHFGNNLGYSKAIRLIVRKFLDQVEARALQGAKHPELSQEVKDLVSKIEG